MSGDRHYYFAAGLVAVYLLPLAIPNVGLDWPYFFVMVIILLAWFLLRWVKITAITQKGLGWEVVLGLLAIGGIYTYNFFKGSPVGILDLLILFLAMAVIFYGFGSLKSFWVPATYGLVLLTGYQIEKLAPNYVALQDWLAGVMVAALNAFRIGATASGHIVSMNLPNGSIEMLNVEGSCTGLQGILAFGMLSTMALIDASPRMSRLIPIFAIGFIGAFLTNIGRLLAVFLTFEYFGADAGITVHVYLGYLMFLAWVLVFWALAFRYLM